MSLSGWCSPGPVGSMPDHTGCTWDGCACMCHDTLEEDTD